MFENSAPAKYYSKKQNKKYYEILTIYECVDLGFNITICLKLNSLFYNTSRILQLSKFVWKLRSSVKVFFNNFLLIEGFMAGFHALTFSNLGF